ncbi:MAG TPA: acyltransferase domain-containing protein, partial [Sphaerochaeta sp.]|nr:acyltransferase domain-containing protein [Sphaerochaeta sp.]
MVASSIALLEKQENRSLFLLFDQGFKEFGPLYPLVLIYALYPKVVSLYSRLGISDQVRQATLADIAIWV